MWYCKRCLGRMKQSRWGNWFEHLLKSSSCECQGAVWLESI